MSAVRQRNRRNSHTREYLPAKDALDLAQEQHENVFLFVPNLIGYVRFITAAIALYMMPFHPKASTLAYFTSCILDVADGQAARALDQCSKYGAVLDMVLDRCTTACLMCFLASAYPRLALLFQALITLDFSSHYIHMYSTLTTGGTSHKLVRSDVSRILWLYYNSSRTLFFFCFCNETFFVCLYVMTAWTTPIGIPSTWLFDHTPALFARLYPHLTIHASRALGDLTWPALVAILTFPVCLAKQIVNVVQFWKAAKVLVGVDLAERRQARLQRLQGSAAVSQQPLSVKSD